MPSSVSIRTVAQRTGLTTFVIRAWERRYNLLSPARSPGGHRVYSEADIQRLTLIAQAVRLGRSIGSVAHLSEPELRTILSNAPRQKAPRAAVSRSKDPTHKFQSEILSALHHLDARRLDKALDEARVALGWQGALELVISPVATRVGELWRAGQMTIAQERFFTVAVKVHLCSRLLGYAKSRSTPRIVLATPYGQHHELGAVLAAAAAANLGWEVAYLGPSIPSEDLAGALLKFDAKVLALSLVFPPDDPDLHNELRHLGRIVSKDTRILVGGASAFGYAATLKSIGAVTCETLSAFCSTLDQIRSTQGPASWRSRSPKPSPSVF